MCLTFVNRDGEHVPRNSEGHRHRAVISITSENFCSTVSFPDRIEFGSVGPDTIGSIKGESAKVRMPGEMELNGPEIFVGLVGAVGTDLRSTGYQLKEEFHRVGYAADIIRLSSLMLDIDRFADLAQLKDGPEDERINKLMDAGDLFREAAQRGDAVALLAIGRIRAIREAMTNNPEIPACRHAYISTRSNTQPNRYPPQRLWQRIFRTFRVLTSGKAGFVLIRSYITITRRIFGRGLSSKGGSFD